MKRKMWQDLLAQDNAQLQQKLTELVIDLTKKRHEKIVGRLTNPSGLARLADDVARIKTVLRQREKSA